MNILGEKISSTENISSISSAIFLVENIYCSISRKLIFTFLLVESISLQVKY